MPATKFDYGFSHLRDSDQKSVELINDILSDVMDERIINDFVSSFSDGLYCGLTSEEEKSIRQIERIFLVYLKKRATEILDLRINEIVEDYDGTYPEDQRYVRRAISVIKQNFEGECKHG